MLQEWRAAQRTNNPQSNSGKHNPQWEIVMRTLHKWAIGGSLTAAFGAVALWPVEMQIEGPVTNTFSIGSLKPDVWDVEQVYIAPENTDIPFQRGNRGEDTIRNLKHAKRRQRSHVLGCGAAEIGPDRGWALFPSGNRRSD